MAEQNEDVFQNLKDGFSSLGKKVTEFVDDVMSGDPMSRGVSVKTDVYQYNKEYVLQLELPGINKKDVDIKIYEGILIVKGVKTAPEGLENVGFEKSERRFGDFRRDFQLPQNAEMSNIKAKFENGVLSIRFPRDAQDAAPEESKEIDID